MLRYSTSNVEKQATLEQEVSHVKNYLLLMQKRYQDMLDYQVDLPEQFKRVSIPKLVLQIFVENSIKYSFDAGKESVKIQIIISDSATEEWRIAIFDDGPGISEAKIQYLERKITEIQDTLDRHASLNQLDFEIGGLGIINTYARLRLFYGKRFNLLIESSENGTKIFLYKEKEGVYK